MKRDTLPDYRLLIDPDTGYRILDTGHWILDAGSLKEASSGPGGLFKTLSIGPIACGLIFKGLRKHTLVLKDVFCDGS